MEEMAPSRISGEQNGADFGSMDKFKLEKKAVAAIQEHRRLLVADEAVYEAWCRAKEDPSTSSAVLQTLQDEYLSRQRKSDEQQRDLAKIVDALGYIPDVPEADRS